MFYQTWWCYINSPEGPAVGGCYSTHWSFPLWISIWLIKLFPNPVPEDNNLAEEGSSPELQSNHLLCLHHSVTSSTRQLGPPGVASSFFHKRKEGRIVVWWFGWEWPQSAHIFACSVPNRWTLWEDLEVWPYWNGCGLVGGGERFGRGFEASKAHTRPSGSLSACLPASASGCKLSAHGFLPCVLPWR